MLTYAQLRERARDGDVIAVEGTALFSRLIRVFTGESYSHIAVLIWMDDGLFVFEMKEGDGFLITPASDWFALNRRRSLLWCEAPHLVRGHPEMLSHALSFRGRDYGWYSLASVWMGQVFGRWWHREGVVCSTFAQRLWERCGLGVSEKPADPGDIVRLSGVRRPVTWGNPS